ncbi:ABC transporter substrate-binding protein [Psychromicrobium xiongbiense]|uniref:ABC transporter substrate-binding protein n=1 Tax=Psychromicrobium xiongbiense TaxID=3051184 RepID=UPI0025574B78|nr:ABC transporter substrate-binding protein [Psychromicrobium sp. YIM S02556]
MTDEPRHDDFRHDEEIQTTRIVAGQKATSQKPTAQKPSGQKQSAAHRISPRNWAIGGIAAVVLIALGAFGITAAATASSQQEAAAGASATDDLKELKLGYFGNVTHAVPVVGVQQGIYQKTLGATSLKTQIFNAGPAAVEALNAGAIDAAYLGPNPAINSFVKSKGQSIAIVAGSASGGAQLVVKPGINSAADLKGKVLATPQLGGTQDVALRNWLAGQGLRVQTNGGNDVTINPTDNAQTLKLFQDGKLDGAWLPEPWASRLVLQAGGKVLVDEKDLWSQGQFSTTILIVNKTFLAAHPHAVTALLTAQLDTQAWLQQHPGQAVAAVNDGLKQAAGAALPEDVVSRALSNLSFTADPLASTYPALLANGVKAGVTQDADIKGIFDLRLLNEVLRQRSQPTVSAGDLGQS